MYAPILHCAILIHFETLLHCATVCDGTQKLKKMALQVFSETFLAHSRTGKLHFYPLPLDELKTLLFFTLMQWTQCNAVKCSLKGFEEDGASSFSTTSRQPRLHSNCFLRTWDWFLQIWTFKFCLSAVKLDLNSGLNSSPRLKKFLPDPPP